MPAPADLVYQQSGSTGASNLTLSTVTGRRTFATAFSTGSTTNVFDYFIVNNSANEWEIGTGHMADATTLVRDTVVRSSNSNTFVTFSAGVKDITNDVPADYQVRTSTNTVTDGHAVVFNGTSGNLIKSAGLAFPTTATGSGSLVLATSPSLTTPSLSGETFSTSATVAAAGTTQATATGLTSDLNVITTTATNSGVVLPTATVGRRITVINRGNVAVNVYPATGAAIDGLAANAALSLPLYGVVEINASSTSQWYSSNYIPYVAPSTSGNLLTSNGTNWTSSPTSTVLGGSTIVRSTAVATTSGREIIYSGIPSWVKRITLMLYDFSTNGTSLPIFQVGIAAGFVTTGYLSNRSYINNAQAVATGGNANAIGFSIAPAWSAANRAHGVWTLTNISANIWMYNGQGTYFESPSFSAFANGSIDLATSPLTQLRLIPANWTSASGDTFDSGQFNIMYQG